MLHLFILDDAVHLGLPALIPEAENLIRDGVVIVLLAERPVNGIDYHLFQKRFIDCPVVAGVAGGLQAAAAPPDDGLAASVVPVDAPEDVATVATDDEVGKGVAGRIAAFLSVSRTATILTFEHFLLGSIEKVLGDNGLVMIFNIILRHLARILDSALSQKVDGVGFLQKGIAHVLLVLEDFPDGRVIPFGLSCSGQDPVGFQSFGNGVEGLAFQVFPEDPADVLGFLGDEDEVSILILVIAQEAVVVALDLALLVAVL